MASAISMYSDSVVDSASNPFCAFELQDISEFPKNTQWPPSERQVIGLPAQSLSEYASKESEESPPKTNPKELVCFKYAKQRRAVSQCNARGDEKY